VLRSSGCQCGCSDIHKIVANKNDIFGSSGVIGANPGSIEIEASVEMIHPDGRVVLWQPDPVLNTNNDET